MHSLGRLRSAHIQTLVVGPVAVLAGGVAFDQHTVVVVRVLLASVGATEVASVVPRDTRNLKNTKSGGYRKPMFWTFASKSTLQRSRAAWKLESVSVFLKRPLRGT